MENRRGSGMPILPQRFSSAFCVLIMSNPQIENGHIDLANEIVDKLARYRISGEEYQILWTIWRKTYGWHKKDDKISLSQFSIMTDLKRPTVARAIKKLLSKKIIIIKKDNTYINSYRFNKDFDEWQAIIKKDTGVIKKDNQVLSKKIHTKETITKEKIVKPKKIVEVFEPFNGLIEIEKWLNDKQRHIQIVGLWGTLEKPSLENKDQFKNFTDRTIRTARTLIGYSNERIKKTRQMLKDKGLSYTLETIAKHIDSIKEPKKEINYQLIDGVMHPIYGK